MIAGAPGTGLFSWQALLALRTGGHRGSACSEDRRATGCVANLGSRSVGRSVSFERRPCGKCGMNTQASDLRLRWRRVNSLRVPARVRAASTCSRLGHSVFIDNTYYIAVTERRGALVCPFVLVSSRLGMRSARRVACRRPTSFSGGGLARLAVRRSRVRK